VHINQQNILPTVTNPATNSVKSSELAGISTTMCHMHNLKLLIFLPPILTLHQNLSTSSYKSTNVLKSKHDNTQPLYALIHSFT